MPPVPLSLDAVAPDPGALRSRGETSGEVAVELDFDATYEEHFDLVWRNARRLGVPEAQVDDAVQEVFLVVHRRLGDFEGRASVKTWIFGILAKVAADHRRSVRRKSPHARSVGGVVDVDTVADEEASPHRELVRSEGVKLLHRLLDELDDERRAVFVLAELEQMSAPEIAEALGVKLNTVYARLRAAREQFNESAQRERARDTWRLR